MFALRVWYQAKASRNFASSTHLIINETHVIAQVYSRYACCIEQSRSGMSCQMPLSLSRKLVSLSRYVHVTRAISRNTVKREFSILYARKEKFLHPNIWRNLFKLEVRERTTKHTGNRPQVNVAENYLKPESSEVGSNQQREKAAKSIQRGKTSLNRKKRKPISERFKKQHHRRYIYK